MRGQFLNALLGGFAGAGSGIAQQRQFTAAEETRRRQGENDDLDRQFKGMQIAQMQAPPKAKWTYDSSRGALVNEDTGEVKQLRQLPQPFQAAKAPTAPHTISTKTGIYQLDTDGKRWVPAVDPGGKTLMPDHVDPKPEKPEKTGFDALPQTQQTQAKLQQTALLNMQRAIASLQKEVAADGMGVGPGERRAKLEALEANARIQYKEAANLGAISGSDLTLINGALGSATNPLQYARGGAKGVIASLQAARQSLRDRARTMENVYQIRMPEDFYTDDDQAAAPAPAGGRGGNPAALSAAPSREQKLWDDAVRLHGVDKVTKLYGARPPL